MRAALGLALGLVLAVAACGGEDEPERELEDGRVAIGVVSGEPEVAKGVRVATNRIDNAGGIGGALTIDLLQGTAQELLAAGVRLFVLPCREGLAESAALVERQRAVGVAPCDDGELPPGLARVFPTGLSPEAQAAALEDYLDGDAARLLAPTTERGERVRALLDLPAGGPTPVSPDALEAVTAPPDAPEGTIFATYGFPDPGNRADEFAERFKAVYDARPRSILAALGSDALDVLAKAVEEAQSPRPRFVVESFAEGFEVRGALGEIVFPGETRTPEVEATIVRLSDGKLRTVESG